MESDIVARLRAVLHNDRSVELMNREAADEIERLRKERDEARILACKGLALEARHTMDKIGPKIWSKTALTPQEMAKERGWDCLKEEADYNNEYFRTHHK